MNDDYEGVDPRPNLWARPDGNFAKLEFDGWNIHHTTGLVKSAFFILYLNFQTQLGKKCRNSYHELANF